MPRYVLALYTEPDAPEPEDIDGIMRAIDALNDRMRDSKVWVDAAGMEPPHLAKIVTAGEDDAEVTDGPLLRSAVQLSGFWVIDARSMGDALIWAERASRAVRLPVEVRAMVQDRR